MTATLNETSYGSPTTEHFVDILEHRDGDCVCLEVRRHLIEHAVRKDGSKKNNKDDNLIFPPSTLKKRLDSEVVRRVLQCKCTVCKAAPRGNIADDKFLVDNLVKENDHGKSRRSLLGTLIYMGTPFVIRHMFSISTPGNPSPGQREAFEAELFAPLYNEGLLPHPKQTIDAFFFIFAQIERLFNSPMMELRSNTRYADDENLPFIEESLLGNINSSFGTLYRFRIHEEFRGDDVPQELVRKEVVFKEADEEQRTLSFLQICAKPTLIQMLFWYRIGDKINYVFPEYPGSLLHILNGSLHPPADSKPEKYGGKLNHWMWQGVVDVLEGLKFFHNPMNIPEIDRKVIIAAHFDMKPANILVDRKGRFIIIDFGQARLKKVELDGGTDIQAHLGDINYKPPDSFSYKRARHGLSPNQRRAYDVWSMACIMVEVIEYILNDKDGRGPEAFKAFAASRKGEDDNDFAFWRHDLEKSEQDAFVLRPSVQAALRRFRNQQDSYLEGVTDLLVWMFDTRPEARPTISECFSTVSEDIPTDQWPLLDYGEVSICGLGVTPQLRNMYTQFQRAEETKMRRCKLYLLLHPQKQRVRSAVEFKQDVEEKLGAPTLSCVLSDSASLGEETFKPQALFRHNYNKESPEAWRYSFGSMHPNLTFQFDGGQRGFGDFHHFLAAATKQKNISRHINLKIVKCVYKPARILSQEVNLGSGHAQVWKQLSGYDYKRQFIDRRAEQPRSESHLYHNDTSLHKTTTRRSTRGSTSTGSSSSNTASGSKTEASGPIRLAVFIPGTTSRLLTINLTDGYNELHLRLTCRQKRSRAHVWFLHRGANFCIGNIASLNDCPGIPMDTEALGRLESLLKVDWVEIEFADDSAVDALADMYE